MSRSEHIVTDTNAHTFVCKHCGAKEGYELPMPIAEYVKRSREFIRAHDACPAPAGPKEEEIPMAKERKAISCSRCGESGHNARGCPKRAVEAPPATMRKNRGGRRVLDPKTDAAAPRTPAMAPASPVNGITIHNEHSIVTVTTEGGATVIRVREVGREG